MDIKKEWLRWLCALAVMLLGVVVMLAWHGKIDQILQINHGFVPMVYNTAFSFLLAGVALLFIKHRLITIPLAVILILLGCATLFQHATGINLGIDELVFKDTLTPAASAPGRMAINTSLCFTISGVCFLIASRKNQKTFFELTLVMLGLFIFIISSIAFLNYFIDMPLTFSWQSLSDMAIHTAIGFVVLSLGIVRYGVSECRTTKTGVFAITPMIMLAIGTILSIVLWQYMTLEEERDIQRSLKITQNYLDDYIQDIIGYQASILYQISNDMISHHETRISEEIIQNTKRDHPQVDGLGVLTPSGAIDWGIRINNQEAIDVIEEKLRNASLGNSEMIYSIVVPGVGRGFLMTLPYYDNNVYKGTLFTAYDSEALFSKALSSNVLENFGVAIYDGDKNIYQSDKILENSHEEQWNLVIQIQMKNVDWDVHIWPQTELIQEVYSSAPVVVFIGSLFLMLMVSTVIQLGINLKIANRQEKEASEAKSKFLSSMSHELRTPLNAILGYAQLLEYSQTATEKEKENATKIQSAGKHLLSLINDILDLSKIEAGKIDISLESIKLQDLIEECYELSKPIAEKFHINLLFENFKSDCFVRADYFRLKQVLLNLITNAIKYNKENGTVDIKVEKITDNKLKISVIDTGPGLSKEQINNLFQPFQRLVAEKTNIEGTGIGLVITKELVEKMHGQVFVESEPEEGTTFWIELVEDTEPKDLQQYIQNVEKKAEALSALSAENIKILIAEDNPANQEVIKQQLQFLGYKCDIANNGEEAYDKWLKNEYDIILMDCNMPKMDGYETTKRIRKDQEGHEELRIPIIAFTANALKEDIDKCKEAGMDDFLVKPVDLETLQAKLNEFLGEKDDRTS